MYSNEIRNLAITKLKQGTTISEVSKQLDISYATVYNWSKKIKTGEKKQEVVTESKKDVQIVSLDEIHNQINQLVAEDKLEEALQLTDELNRKLQQQCIDLEVNEGMKFVLNNIENDLSDANTVVKNNNSDEISLLLTRIYCNDISSSEIETSQIGEFEKTILMIALYEKTNKLNGIKFVKEKKKICENTADLKILNILLERLMNKKNVLFDTILYGNYLNCSINYGLVDQITKRKEAEKKMTIISENKKTEKVKQTNENKVTEKSTVVMEQKVITAHGKKVSSRHSSGNSSIEKQNIDSKEKLLIKDLFGKEILEIGKYLYVKMGDLNLQKKAIDAWDRLECLANQPISDKDKLQRMISLIRRIENVSDINISLDEKRYSKYL